MNLVIFQLNYLTVMEINTVRPFLTKALDQLHMLRANLQPVTTATQD